MIDLNDLLTDDQATLIEGPIGLMEHWHAIHGDEERCCLFTIQTNYKDRQRTFHIQKEILCEMFGWDYDRISFVPGE